VKNLEVQGHTVELFDFQYLEGVSAKMLVIKVGQPLSNANGLIGHTSDLHQDALDPSKSKEEVYQRWASTYDSDMANGKYNAPTASAQELMKRLTSDAGQTLTVLDAGCGTGLAGVVLHEIAAKTGVALRLDGCDISPDMLEEARKRGYVDLKVVDLNKPVEYATSSFDAVICVGTFTMGHVSAEPALPEMVRVTLPGGFVVATVRTSFYDASFELAVKNLEVQGHTVELFDFQYLEGVSAKMLVIKVGQ